MANFDSEFFGLVFTGFQATQKIHAQNSRPELSAFLSKFTFLNPKLIHGDFLLAGKTNICNMSTLLLYKANSFAYSLANRDTPVAATSQRKSSDHQME